MKNILEMIDDSKMLVYPDHPMISYTGRIDFERKKEPVFVYPASMIEISFTGTSCAIILENKRAYWDSYLGYQLDGKQEKILLSDKKVVETIIIADGLEDRLHSLILFKRMDSCHIFRFFGFVVDHNANILPCSNKPHRKIEVYGDSVSAGEVSEALEYVGKADPPHNGEYSNSYYSYAWLAARKLNAQLHNIAQGGISLLDGSGYFSAPNTIGLLSTYDKIEYYPDLSTPKLWDFSLYCPHVVIVAIGQNDKAPYDYMKEEFSGEEALVWRNRYKEFIMKLRNIYPNALIILTTTILRHDKSWDDAIDMVCNEIDDPKIKHFLYSCNGNGTDGHIRIPEAKKMAEELSDYINAFGEDIWKA